MRRTSLRGIAEGGRRGLGSESTSCRPAPDLDAFGKPTSPDSRPRGGGQVRLPSVRRRGGHQICGVTVRPPALQIAKNRGKEQTPEQAEDRKVPLHSSEKSEFLLDKQPALRDKSAGCNGEMGSLGVSWGRLSPPSRAYLLGRRGIGYLFLAARLAHRMPHWQPGAAVACTNCAEYR